MAWGVFCLWNNKHLPLFDQIAGKVAAPLSRTNEIVILSGEGSRVTGEVNRLLAELPVSVNALTGVDLTKVRILQPQNPNHCRRLCIVSSFFSYIKFRIRYCPFCGTCSRKTTDPCVLWSTDTSAAEGHRPTEPIANCHLMNQATRWFLWSVNIYLPQAWQLFSWPQTLLCNFLWPETRDTKQEEFFFYVFKRFLIFYRKKKNKSGSLLLKVQAVCILCCF